MNEFATFGGIVAAVLSALALAALVAAVVPVLRQQPKGSPLTDAELHEVEAYAAVRTELAAIRAEMAELSRILNGLVTHVDGQHEVVMDAIGRSHDVCKMRRQA